MGTVRLELGLGSIRSEAVDELCEELADDLREIRSVAVRPAAGALVAGAKSPVADSLGTLVLTGTFSVAVVRSVRDVLLAFLNRGQARSVTVRRGDTELVLTAATDAEIARVTDRLDAILGADEPG